MAILPKILNYFIMTYLKETFNELNTAQKIVFILFIPLAVALIYTALTNNVEFVL